MTPDRHHTHDTSDPDGMTELLRRHAHDVRNGLNGFEIEASLIDILHGDERTQESLRRLKFQGAAIDYAVRFLLNRFSDPAPERMPAIDLFNLWKSRSKRLSIYEGVAWSCSVGDAILRVDAGLVADLLCEVLSTARGESLEASASSSGDDILFEVRRTASSQGREPGPVQAWPGFDELVSRSGGHYEALTGADGSFSRSVWFPGVPA